MPDRLNIRYFALATLVPAAMMLVAMWAKPLWRDELFSLYYSEPRIGLIELATERWAIDSHPPIHNVFLWAWSHISTNIFFQKCLSLVFLGIGIFASHRIMPPEYKRRLHVFWLTCLGSYWVIYFATEIRPYVLNFTLSALLTLLSIRIMDSKKPGFTIWIVWLICATILSLTHYFGALFVACLGLAVGIHNLCEGRRDNFTLLGILSTLALIPVIFWIRYISTQLDIVGLASDLSIGDRLSGGLEQFLRGLVIKTFGSNILITALGFGGLVLAIKGHNTSHRTLIAACGLTVIIAFLLHLFFVDMIKERAFIVIMPAIIWILVDHLSRSQHSLIKFIPLVTMIMPFLFMAEYFKNKEKFPELREILKTAHADCETSDLYVFYRQDQPRNFHAYANQYILAPHSHRRLVEINSVDNIAPHDCPIKAVTMLQSKNDVKLWKEIETQLESRGLKLERQVLGKGRTVLWRDIN